MKNACGVRFSPSGSVTTASVNLSNRTERAAQASRTSGGEWIGSIELENIAMAHPGVAMATCIGVFHPKRDERPLLVVMKKPGAPVMLFALLLGMAMNFLSGEGKCAPGIAFTARELLRVGVALLGLRITAAQVAALGWRPALGLMAVRIRIAIGMR